MNHHSDHTTTRVATNRSRRVSMLATLLLAMSTAACVANGDKPSPPSSAPITAASNMKQLTEHDNGATIDVRIGDSVSITLPENPTTGYTWTVDDGGAALLKASPPVRERSSDAVGAGGQVSFAFLAQAAGRTTISLTHRRPWEGQAAAIARYSVTVIVE